MSERRAVVIAITGLPSSRAQSTPETRFAAPGPAQAITTAGSPVTRVMASAAWAAAAPRSGTSRPMPSSSRTRSSASRKIMYVPSGIAQTWRTPSACRLRRSSSPPVISAISRSNRRGPSGGEALAVHRHDHGAAEADVVLQRDLRPRDLTGLGLPPQLPAQLRALGQAGGAERVPLRDQPAGGVDDPLAAVGHGPLVDEVAALALAAEDERLVGDHLVRREAVVQLDHVHVLRPQAGLLVHPLRRQPRHLAADQGDRALALERVRRVGHHRLADDLDRLVLQRVPAHELLAGKDGGGGTVGGGAALELGERRVDHRRGQDLLQRVLVLELRVGVVHGVAVVLEADLRELLRLRPVPLHVLAAGVAEDLRGDRRGLESPELDHQVNVAVHGVDAVCVLGPERPFLHLLEPQGEHAVGDPALHKLLPQEERGRARRAVVVHVVDGDAREPQLVDGALAAGRLAVDVPDGSLLNFAIGDAGVLQRLRPGLLRHVGVVPGAGPWLLELGHSNTHHLHFAGHLSSFSTVAAPAARRVQYSFDRRRVPLTQASAMNTDLYSE